jgi:hypothetical protein
VNQTSCPRKSILQTLLSGVVAHVNMMSSHVPWTCIGVCDLCAVQNYQAMSDTQAPSPDPCFSGDVIESKIKVKSVNPCRVDNYF